MAATNDAAAGAASTTDGAADGKGGTTTTDDKKVTDDKTVADDKKVADDKAAADTTTDDTTTADKGKEPGSKDGAAASKAPEKYDLTLPAGGRIDAQDLTAIETLARSQNWTNEEAQQRVNDHAAAIDAQSTQFLETTKADATYGGDKLPETLKHASAALDHFRPKGTPQGDAFRALLDKSGYGNHLAVVSLLADLGNAMAEDSPLAGHTTGGATTTPKADVKSSADVGAVLYGKS